MIKKITFFLILIFLVVACGKKSEPKYENSKKKTVIENTHIRVS